MTGHGTSVAGIIAASDNDTGITGINPNVDIYSVKVFDMNNEVPISRIIQAINWCVENDVDIINMSFGTEKYSEALESTIKYADENGVLLIASAGNRGGDVQSECIDYPAAYDEVLAVGSIDSSGKRVNDSSTGESLDIMAPGELIESTGAFDGTVIVSGTSMATPHVTGIASLLLEKDKNVSPRFIKDLLKESAKKVDLKNQYGAGVLDYSYALNIYEKFKKEYTESKLPSVVTNKREIESYDTDNYVEGSWSAEQHRTSVTAAIDSTKSMKSWTTTQINVLKRGVVIPDTYFNEGKEYPCKYLHGKGNYIAKCT